MLDILQYDFMIRALVAGIAIAIVAPLVGIFLVVRRYSLMADTLAHVSLTGVAIGLLTKINPIITAIITSTLAAIGIDRLRTAKKILGESVLALFLSGSLAIAVVLISISGGFTVSLFSFLFGSITTVQTSDLYIIIPLSIAVSSLMLLIYKELFFISFDEDLAKASGINVTFLNGLFVTLAGVTVALSIRIIGVLLIGALMVIPVVTAVQFKKGFVHSTLLAIIFSIISVISGLVVSFYLNTASGGTIVIISLLFFIMALIVNRKS